MSRNVTLQEIADYTNVSIATVSRVLNDPSSVRDSTRKMIMDAMNELGFSPKKHRGQAEQSKTILVLLGSFFNRFDCELAESIKKTASFNGYNVAFSTINDHFISYEDYEKALQDISIAGIIMQTGLVDREIVEDFARLYPVVMCSDYIENLDISYVSIDDISAAQNATNYLISTGHSKIALINCNASYRYSKHRKKGYLKALSSAGLESNDAWIVHLSSGDYFFAAAFIREMLEKENRPDAILACSDVYGTAAINAAHQLGLHVPEDLSVIGYDNIDLSNMTSPTLTTVSQPIAQIGFQACELLIEKITSRSNVNKQIILATELIVRNSTKPKNIFLG